MRIHCLGTVGYHPNSTRHTSCYFLPDSGILLDAGTGVYRLAPLIETDSLDILLSHAHLDHTIGLTFLLDVLHELKSLRGRSIDEIRIWGEQEKLDAIRTHLFHELIFPAKINAKWIAIDGMSSWEIVGVLTSFRTQEHPGGSVAYALEWQSHAPKQSIRRKLVYATDNAGDTSSEMAQFGQGADLLIHECYFRNTEAKWASQTGHCFTDRVAQVAQNLRPKKLLITHINPLETSDDPIEIERIREQTECEVILASDEMTVDF